MAAWLGGEFGGEWMHVYPSLSPFSCSPEIITTLLIHYLSVQNKKFFFFFFFFKKQSLKLDSVVTDVGMLFCSPGASAGPSHPLMLSKASGICRELLKLFVSLADSCPFYSLSEQLPNYILNPHLSFY